MDQLEEGEVCREGADRQAQHTIICTMSGKTSPAQVSVSVRSFYGESPPKRSRLQDTSISNLRPAFKTLKDNLIKFDRKLLDTVQSVELKETEQPEVGEEEPKSLDRDSPIPLKNLGNTCYENSIIQCLFSLNMFMDSFERTMKSMRKFVVESKLVSNDARNSPCLSPRSLPRQAQSGADATTITEDDVRYRIADAFDKLYKSYTRKRIQNETISNHNNQTSIDSRQQDPLKDASDPKSEFAIGHTDPFSTCNSTSAVQTATTKAGSNENQPSNETSALPNLAPIALLSSTARSNGQTEIETRLEDLKSAVGERSSQFNSTHQQDASEFFYHVIDSIQEFYQGLGRSNDEENPVTKAFELELDYLIKCPKCHHGIMSEPEKIRTLPLALPHVKTIASLKQEDSDQVASDAPTPPSSDLDIESPKMTVSEAKSNESDEKENQASVTDREDTSNYTITIAKLDLRDKLEAGTPEPSKKHTLDDALNNYFKDDLLEFNCSQPGCDSEHRKRKCLIRKLPQVLFITLARYSHTGKKNLDEIEAPFEMSVPFRENKSPKHSPTAHRELSDEDSDYQLVAVVCHLGSSLNAGHYTSYVYNQNNSSWYSCDDDSITKVQEIDVKNDASRSGYCFFYARKSCLNMREGSHVDVQAKEGQGGRSELDGNIIGSSVILTPESTPSPCPPASQESQAELDHTTCMNESQLADDWS